MNFKEIVNKLESSEEFKKWHENNKSYFLAHFFKILEEDDWQVGYSNGDDVASISLNPIIIEEHQEISKKPNDKVLPLNIYDFKINFDEAKEIFKNLIEEKYVGENTFKTIVLVQNIDGNNVFNITGLTHSFKTLNVKIDSKGNVLSDSLITLVSQS